MPYMKPPIFETINQSIGLFYEKSELVKKCTRPRTVMKISISCPEINLQQKKSQKRFAKKLHFSEADSLATTEI